MFKTINGIFGQFLFLFWYQIGFAQWGDLIQNGIHFTSVPVVQWPKKNAISLIPNILCLSKSMQQVRDPLQNLPKSNFCVYPPFEHVIQACYIYTDME